MENSRLIAAVLGLLLIAGPAFADPCYADYKAKKDNPLRLHYGVVELRQDCTRKSARREIKRRIARDGWTLLNVMSVFEAPQLAGKDQSAGKFYLRY